MSETKYNWRGEEIHGDEPGDKVVRVWAITPPMNPYDYDIEIQRGLQDATAAAVRVVEQVMDGMGQMPTETGESVTITIRFAGVRLSDLEDGNDMELFPDPGPDTKEGGGA